MAVPILNCLLNPELFPNSQANPGFIMFFFSYSSILFNVVEKNLDVHPNNGPFPSSSIYLFWTKNLEIPRVYQTLVIQKSRTTQAPTSRRVADRWPCPAASWHPPAVWSLVACPGTAGKRSWLGTKNDGTKPPVIYGGFLKWGETPSLIIYFNNL